MRSSMRDAGWLLAMAVTCFNGLGKTVADNCEKGMKVLVHGRIHYTKWTDATGTDRYGCEIIAEKVDFLTCGGGPATPMCALS